MDQFAAVLSRIFAAANPSNTRNVNSTNAKPSGAPKTTGRAPPHKKRKRGGHGWTRKKTHHHPKPPAHPDNYNFDRRRYYKIQGIMAESQRRYKIKWARFDSQGGQFLDTWVPKRYANEPAVADWEARLSKGRPDKFNNERGEYDTEGNMFASSITDDEGQGRAKRGKKVGDAKAKGKK